MLNVNEVLSESITSWEDATKKAIACSAKTVKHNRFAFEVGC